MERPFKTAHVFGSCHKFSFCNGICKKQTKIYHRVDECEGQSVFSAVTKSLIPLSGDSFY